MCLHLTQKRECLKKRAAIIRLIRDYLEGQGYFEVETPQRVRTPGSDVNLDAFESGNHYLITSPEFHMKRLLASGIERIYQICHCFRKGERTSLHNPEFTMLEYYSTGTDLSGMMGQTEHLIWRVAERFGTTDVQYNGIPCSLKPPWTRSTVEEVFLKYAGWSPVTDFDEDRFYYDLVDKVERHLGSDKALILYHYPAQLAMLAKTTEAAIPVALRFEVYVAGLEIANAFEELNDSREQRRRFRLDLTKREAQNMPLYPIDDELLKSLDQMPDASGIAVGVDRLVMLLTGADTIDDVIAFPDEYV
jgi:lysyl-tRNA synthetase class 2